ncbi:Clp protease [Kocuria coralli]|uniref:Clp protease n=1 Tax=Kocuria coralli TaxID=1461025 RepID=A0A5J5KXM6_9MICC|nr:SRPBCC family protein [Kocuria coralli]KAA9394527.1 Clp protease [Kocuria coralli]
MFHETGGYDWSQRAIDLIGRAGGKRRDGSAAAVLREFMAEPSGLIADLLTYLGTTPEAIVEALDRDPSVTRVGRTSRPKVKGRVSGSSESFVPAPVEEVWEFLADPARICDWEPGLGSIELGADHDTRDVHLGMTWEARAMTERPDGKPMKVKEAFRRRVVELVMAQYPHRVSWRFSYPDNERGKPVLMEFRLSQTAGGTQVNMTVSWPRREGWRWLAGAPLRPARVFLTWLHLFQIGAAISRAFC